MSRCEQKTGLFGGRCKLESLHTGPHDNGKTTWQRQGSDLAIWVRAAKAHDEFLLEKIEALEMSGHRDTARKLRQDLILAQPEPQSTVTEDPDWMRIADMKELRRLRDPRSYSED